MGKSCPTFLKEVHVNSDIFEFGLDAILDFLLLISSVTQCL
jgi:hypothetical protein